MLELLAKLSMSHGLDYAGTGVWIVFCLGCGGVASLCPTEFHGLKNFTWVKNWKKRECNTGVRRIRLFQSAPHSVADEL